MKKSFVFGLLAGLTMLSVFLASCKDEDSTPFTGIKLIASKNVVEPDGAIEITATYFKEDAADTTATITLSLSADTTGGAYFGSAGTTSTTVTSDNDTTLTMGGKNSGYVIITATNGDASAMLAVGTSMASTISAADNPNGFASCNASANFGGYTGSLTGTTVTNRSELRSAISKGGIIYVKGMIDMTDLGSGSMLPAVGGKSTDSTAARDAWVSTQTDGAYKTYAVWVQEYSKGCSAGTDDRGGKSPQSALYDTMNTLNSAWKSVIQLNLGSNTTIIGVDGNSGIRGGTLSIRNVENVVIRNMTIQDAIDPFAHHEANDGFNAQFDNISIDGAQNVWIDHCTLEDTLTLAASANGEKWQVYDGLCDMKSATTKNITVSYTIFKNHDKTMLIGSSDSDGATDPTARTVTLHHNVFSGCGQRLPMVRNTRIHIYCNLYETGSGGYSNSYAIGNRANASIVAENNYFGSGITPSSNSDGSLWGSGNNVSLGSGSKPFEPMQYYPYVLDSSSAISSSLKASSGITSAGAGKEVSVTK